MMVTLAELKLPVFLPGNNRNWKQIDGVATIDSEGEIHVKLLSTLAAMHLVKMAEEGTLFQVSFDYKLDVDTLEKINTQHQRNVGEDDEEPKKTFSRDTSRSWTAQPGYNLLLLKTQQTYANDRLRMQKHLFLNEVYDMLGLPRTRDGAVTGWTVDGTDGFVDFGVGEVDSDGAIPLEFNVQGVIYDKI